MLKQNLQRFFYPILISISFLIWVYLFRTFFLGKIALLEDANVYFEHFKYYIDQIQEGVYPLWDPTRGFGISNEFFLRRIGSFNPFIFLILLLNKIALPFSQSYFAFLEGYYFLGLIGFYLLAKTIYQNKFCAFLAYLFLMFSSFATLLINSFVILEFTPGVWFFYFCINFFREKKEIHWWGMIFCLTILLTTYIPFYFFFIFSSFLLIYLAFNLSQIKFFKEQLISFTKQHKKSTFIGVFLIGIYLIPGIDLYLQGKKNLFVLPFRQNDAQSIQQLKEQSLLISQEQHSFAVPEQSNSEGGIIPLNLFNELFFHHKDVQSGMFYVPIIIHIFFLFALFVKLNKRIMILTIWALCIYLIGVYDAAPFYQWFYNYVFFFKYFRNFQFFLWLVLLPVYILLSVELFRLFLLEKEKNLNLKLIFIGLIHICFAVFLFLNGEYIPFSFISIMLGTAFFFLLFFKKLSLEPFGVILLTIAILIHPVRIFSYLKNNVIPYTDKYRYEDPYFLFTLVRGTSMHRSYLENEEFRKEVDLERPIAEYINTQGINIMLGHIPKLIIMEYARFKFIAYDYVEWIDRNNLNFSNIKESIDQNLNKVFVMKQTMDDASVYQLPQTLQNINEKALLITTESEQFKVLKYDANSIELKVNFPKTKFLVFNDAYDPFWEVFVNYKKNKLWQANVGFKGVFIPAGEQIIKFRYGSIWRYSFNYLLIFLSMAILVYLGFLTFRERKSI